jgi:hypothetical protein
MTGPIVERIDSRVDLDVFGELAEIVRARWATASACSAPRRRLS